MRRIEAVIVCVNYADFLEHTLPENIEQVDRLVVVTHPDDKATQALCDRYSVDWYATTEMHRDGDKFNKARAINYGISQLRCDGWILQMDADTLLPHRFKEMLEHAQLEEDFIYGADRLNCLNYENWIANKHKITPQFQYRYLVTAVAEFPMGARLLHKEYGYCPIGYFQLWHSRMNRKYPVTSGSAEHSDVVFAIQWPRRKRMLLPEFFCYHLESETGNMGANWKGRTTAKFGPKPKAELKAGDQKVEHNRHHDHGDHKHHERNEPHHGHREIHHHHYHPPHHEHGHHHHKDHGHHHHPPKPYKPEC